MLRLVQIDNGRFDLAFADTTATDNMDDVETIVYAALFTDHEAHGSMTGTTGAAGGPILLPAPACGMSAGRH